MHVVHSPYVAESRRDEEEGGELDSHEEASPEEIKSREVVLGWRERERERLRERERERERE